MNQLYNIYHFNEKYLKNNNNMSKGVMIPSLSYWYPIDGDVIKMKL